MARFRPVLELLVVAFSADANPTVGLKPFDHLGTLLVVYQYTITGRRQAGWVLAPEESESGRLRLRYRKLCATIPEYTE